MGFFPRAHYRDPNTTRLSYILDPGYEYSIVLTKIFIAHAEYLRRYTCSTPPQLHAYVDEHKNCEDISMNFLASHLSGQAPLLVEDNSKVDYGTTSGLSLRRTHVSSRYPPLFF